MGTISSLLFLSMVWRMLLVPALQFFYQGTVFQSVISVPKLLVFGPIPTLYRLVASPIVRWVVFAEKELLPALGWKKGAAKPMSGEADADGDADETEGGHGEASGEGGGGGSKRERTLPRSGGSGGGAMAAQLRKRGAKKETKTASEQTKEAVLLGKGIGGTSVGENTEAKEQAAAEAAAEHGCATASQGVHGV
jgi:hypothetical protein